MKKGFLSLWLSVAFIMVFASMSYASRFWVASAKAVPEDIIREQLIDLPYSLKKLGKEFHNGWSVALYKGTAALVARSEKSSSEDDRFDQAVNNASLIHPKIMIGHLRGDSTGCSGEVPNPYPFQRFYNGKNWMFGHNGDLDKELLISLISEEYLQAKPPQACNDDPPTSWVDSELYFIYLLKKIDEADRNVIKGLQNAIDELSGRIGEEQTLNFFLADGNHVWAYRKGTSLYYTYDPTNQLSIISSTIPGTNRFEWKEFPEDHFALLRPHKKPKFYDLKK